jgi:hypothetical protein
MDDEDSNKDQLPKSFISVKSVQNILQLDGRYRRQTQSDYRQFQNGRLNEFFKDKLTGGVDFGSNNVIQAGGFLILIIFVDDYQPAIVDDFKKIPFNDFCLNGSISSRV